MKAEITNDFTEDPIIREVREVREQLAREAGYDLHTMCERLREAEKRHPERVVCLQPQVANSKADETK